jgi:hypothetical protein
VILLLTSRREAGTFIKKTDPKGFFRPTSFMFARHSCQNERLIAKETFRVFAHVIK